MPRARPTHGPAHALHQMVERAHPAAGDDRHVDRIRDRPRQLEVEARPRAVAVHRREQDLARAERNHLARILHRVDSGRLAAAMGEDLQPLPLAVQPDTLRVDGDDDALRAELLRRLPHQIAIGDDGRVDRDLVRAGFQQLAHVLDAAHAAADRQRHEAALRGALHHVENGAAVLVTGGDIEEAELVRAGLVIGCRRLDRIARILQVEETYALDDAAFLHIEARYDANFQHGCL